ERRRRDRGVGGEWSSGGCSSDRERGAPDVAAATAGPASGLPPGRWLLLIYRVPSEPSRLRATVWRRIKSLGAIYLQNSAAALPRSEERRVGREIRSVEDGRRRAT